MAVYFSQFTNEYIEAPCASIMNRQKIKKGGDKRTRTAGICLAKAALYQLSYTPDFLVV